MIDYTRLKDIREDNDLSQSEIAKILGVNRSTYSLWELGINIIPLEYLSKFSDNFNYTIDYVLGLSNKRNAKVKKGFDIKKLGENMKKVRIKNHYSQRSIANILDVTQSCIVRYEKGTICISTSNLYKFCKEFNTSINDICGK